MERLIVDYLLFALQAFSTLAVMLTLLVYRAMLQSMQQQMFKEAQLAHDAARQNAWQNLFSAFDHINDYIAEYVTSPDVRMVPPYEFVSDPRIVMLLFHHLNMLFRFWVNKALMTPSEKIGIERWIRVVFLPWVEKNGDLTKDLRRIIIESRDLYPQDFIEWFASQPGVRELLQ